MVVGLVENDPVEDSVLGCEVALTALPLPLGRSVPADLASSMEPVGTCAVAGSAFPWTNAAATKASNVAKMIIVPLTALMLVVHVMFLAPCRLCVGHLPTSIYER